MSVTIRVQAQQLVAALSRLGVEVPAVVEAHERAGRLATAVRGISPRPNDLYAAVAAAIDRGKDPAADAEVQRLATAIAVGNEGVVQNVDNLTFGQLRDVCREHADTVVAALAAPFDQAVGDLHTASQRSTAPLDSADAWLRAGPDAAGIWTKAQVAASTIGVVRDAWRALASLSGLALHPPYMPLQILDVSFDEWQGHELAARRQIGAWEAMTGGLTLGLPTFSQYAARISVIERGAQLAAAREAEEQSAYRSGRRPRTAAA